MRVSSVRAAGLRDPRGAAPEQRGDQGQFTEVALISVQRPKADEYDAIAARIRCSVSDREDLWHGLGRASPPLQTGSPAAPRTRN